MEISMKVIKCENYQEMSNEAAKIVSELIKSKPDCVLGLATGSTPEGLYANLVSMYERHELDFSRVRSVNLDEYYPISPENDQSYRYFMNKHLFNHVNIDPKNTYVPDGSAKDPEEACRKYEEIIAALPQVDIQILGIGKNGHIGFNEPAEKLEPLTHVTGLTASTIEANARFFTSVSDVPTQALTMGIGSILKAKKIIIMANGEGKREAISQLLEGSVTTSCPASMLNLHSDVVVICDRAALGECVCTKN